MIYFAYVLPHLFENFGDREMIETSDNCKRAEQAFAKHIPHGYIIRTLERNVRVTEQYAYEWQVEYPCGTQIHGTCYLTDENGYSICTTSLFEPESRVWHYPHTWVHGFLETR